MRDDLECQRDPAPSHHMLSASVRLESCPAQPVRWHECANLFPMLQGAPFDALVEDIRQSGVREPIVMLDGAILDGRNRYMAARQLGIEYPVTEYDGDDPLGFVVSLNLKRRHLSESQRAMVASKIANLKKGDNQHTVDGQICPTSTAAAADMLNVSERSVKTARKVREDGDQSLVTAVEADRVSVSAAADIATLPGQEQAEIVARGEREILDAARRIRAARTRAVRDRNRERAAATMAPPSGRYGTLVVDPPWPMEKISRDVHPDQAGFDYPTMTEAELVAFGAIVDQSAHDNAHLFLWTTHKFLPMALRLLETWGWKYVLTMVWHKPGGFQPFGLPQYNCEFCLYARRGAPEFRETSRFPVCFEAARREHSRKPDAFYDLVRRVTHDGRIDVFSRERRPGFAQYGNETDTFGAAAGAPAVQDRS